MNEKKGPAFFFLNPLHAATATSTTSVPVAAVNAESKKQHETDQDALAARDAANSRRNKHPTTTPSAAPSAAAGAAVAAVAASAVCFRCLYSWAPA